MLHSDFEVGFDNAKTIGLSLSSAIRLRIAGVNIRGVPDTPMIVVGRTVSIIPSGPAPRGIASLQLFIENSLWLSFLHSKKPSGIFQLSVDFRLLLIAAYYSVN